MDAPRNVLPTPQSPAAQKPVEMVWNVLLSTDAQGEYDFLARSFDEFEPHFQSAMSQLIWIRNTPRETSQGLYELILPEGRTMPTIRIQYALTDRAMVVRSISRTNLLGGKG